MTWYQPSTYRLALGAGGGQLSPMSDEQQFDPHAIIDGHHSEAQRFVSLHEALIACPRGKRQMRERIQQDQWKNKYATHSADVVLTANGPKTRVDCCTFVSEQLRLKFNCAGVEWISEDLMDEMRRLAFEQINERIALEMSLIETTVKEITTAGIN